MSPRIRFCLPQADDLAEFTAAVGRSRRLHQPWVSAPATPAAFANYLARMVAPSAEDLDAQVQAVREGRWAHCPLLVKRRGGADSGALVGVINLSNAVRGVFLSAYLGYYAFEGQQGQGLMREALHGAVRLAFGPMGLHRLEANIQPTNLASLALVARCGFVKEGYSPRYLKIGGRWRDHERWAVVKP